jgi:uncharacterized membrane protein
MTALPSAAERYLRDLERCLSALPAAERAEIVAEIRSHLAERPQAAADPAAALGRPEVYAASFVEERALAGALATGSSWALGRALVAGAQRLAWWYVVAVLAVVYLYGAILVVLGALKPFFPAHIGVFVHDGTSVSIGTIDHPERATEVLGAWAVPVFVGAGVLVLWGAHVVLRMLARWRLAALGRARLTPGPAAA